MRTPQLASRLVASFALVCAPLAMAAQNPASAPQSGAVRSGESASVRRESWQRVPDIFVAVGARAGSRIADLGAGEGWLTVRLARRVGPSGRVFAVDISEASLRLLAEQLEKDTLRNVELVLAEEDDPRLPFGTLDGVVILNAYHEMTKRVPVLEGVKRALKPGGLLVIVDNIPRDSSKSRKEQIAGHVLALDFARDDLEAQGFEIISTDPRFIDYKAGDHRERQWLLVARRNAK
jgi:ubiquinone/menaquinone biosynthesis C-methylase UbiE